MKPMLQVIYIYNFSFTVVLVYASPHQLIYIMKYTYVVPKNISHEPNLVLVQNIDEEVQRS